MKCFVMTLIIAPSLTILLFSLSWAAPKGVPEILSLPSLCEAMGLYGAQKCKSDPQIRQFGCVDLRSPEPQWGGLKPHVALGICLKKKLSEYVRLAGCKSPLAEQYIVLIQGRKKNELKLIKNGEEFRQFFAPIEEPKEAISYIMALTDAFPMYSFPEQYFINSMDEGGRYLVKSPKPTEVEEKKDGFHVRLFKKTKCGCHIPRLDAVEYLLSKEGNIKEVQSEKVWEASRSYQICID